MRFVTDFADQAVILPLILAVAAMLAVQGWRRGALVWLAVIGGTFLAVLGLKLTCLSCMPVFGRWHVYSPSGHTAAAAVVAGGLALMASRRPAAILPAALAAALVIGTTRVLLGLHTLPEVAIGGALGLIGAAALRRFAGPVPPMRCLPVLGVAAAMAALLHGVHLPAERAIHQTAFGLAWFIPACRPDVLSPPALPPPALPPWAIPPRQPSAEQGA
jgi:hypothetical protein